MIRRGIARVEQCTRGFWSIPNHATSFCTSSSFTPLRSSRLPRYSKMHVRYFADGRGRGRGVGGGNSRGISRHGEGNRGGRFGHKSKDPNERRARILKRTGNPHLVGREIFVSEVRVIDEEGTQLGVLKTKAALSLAEKRGLDLVEVAPKAVPPVCKFQDFKVERYRQEKKQKELKKKARESNKPSKGMRFKVGIEENDLGHKLKQTIRFIEKGHPVVLEVLFTQRIWLSPEPTELELARAKKLEREGRELLSTLADHLSDVAVPQSSIERAKAGPDRIKITFNRKKN